MSDGIERTTARLDILEGHNPELVTNVRVSHRARLAKKYSEPERSMRDCGTSWEATALLDRTERLSLRAVEV